MKRNAHFACFARFARNGRYARNEGLHVMRAMQRYFRYVLSRDT